jgi:predicted transcriptional regulator of viral defense system
MPRTTPRMNLSTLARAAKGGMVTVEIAAELLHVPKPRASQMLASLARRGWLSRVRKGLYLIHPLEATPGMPGVVEDPWVLAALVYEPCYIAGWSAAEHWGLTEQIFRSVFVATAASHRRSSETIMGIEFRLARIDARRVKKATPVWRGRERVLVSSREDTLADALASPEWVGGVRLLGEMLGRYRESKEWDGTKLLHAVRVLGRGVAFKRLGFLAERLFPGDKGIVEACLRGRSSGVVRLDPSVTDRRRLSKKWGLWVNAAVEVAST